MWNLCIQNDDTNWLHPLGFAYEPDGAHEGVDELEAGIQADRGTGGCKADNTCQAPMYYFDSESDSRLAPLGLNLGLSVPRGGVVGSTAMPNQRHRFVHVCAFVLTDDFLGANDENGGAEPTVYPAAGNNGNFGLDHYEPGFAVSRGDWFAARDAGTGLKNNVRLTITDTTVTADLFYFW